MTGELPRSRDTRGAARLAWTLLGILPGFTTHHHPPGMQIQMFELTTLLRYKPVQGRTVLPIQLPASSSAKVWQGRSCRLVAGVGQPCSLFGSFFSSTSCCGGCYELVVEAR